MFLFLLCTSLLLLWLLAKPFHWKGKGIKYLTPWPVFGNFGEIFTLGRVAFGQKIYGLFPGEKVYGFHMFLTPSLIVKDPEIMVDVCIKDFDHFTGNGHDSNLEYDLTGGNLLFLQGTQWKTVRSKLSPFFTPAKIKAMLSLLDTSMPKLYKVLDDPASTGEPVNLGKALSQLTLDVITQAIFGFESDSFEENSKFQPLTKVFFSPKAGVMLVLRNLSRKLFKYLRLQSFEMDRALFLKQLFREVVEYRRKNNVKAADFVQGIIDIMDEAEKNGVNGKVEYFPDGTRKPKYDFEEMFLHAFIIFVGGVETTATTMTWMFYELALNQTLQERCREEVRSVMEARGRQVTLDDIKDIPTIVNCIKEATRMYPPFVLLPRVCTKTYWVKQVDITLYPGQFVVFPSQAVQRDPQYFPEPDTFNPDRFIDNDPKTGLITTFGLGPRICIAKSVATNEMILVISQLLHKYKFTLNPKTEVPLRTATYRSLNSPRTPVWLDVTKI